eukprot:TRINITY_DN36467_c0_g1_i3.p1 TRINITY_DN36467_c0_g1~~TRINITY_DN36467_c0_g1_i3.p1  ORF type:complete len:452 (+),score=84.94 TRINITY_DN36467_c0_g1_i3:96-1451(+)
MDHSGCLPGTHHLLANHFRRHGTAGVEQRGDKALPQDLPFPAPVQVRLRAGDAVIAHHLLAHSVGPNTSDSIRYAIYFRVNASTHPNGTYRKEAMTDLWADWPAAARVAPELPLRHYGTDEEVVSLRSAGEPLFEGKDWASAAPIYGHLSDLRPADYWFAFKAGAAAVWAGGAEGGRAAVAPLERAVALCPALPAAHALLVRAHVAAGSWVDALAAARRFTDAPGHDRAEAEEGWCRELVDSALSGALEAVRKLGRGGEGDALRAAFQQRCPFLVGRTSTAELWRQGLEAIKKEPKSGADWATARACFEQLAQLQGEVMWAPLLAGICHAYGGAGAEAGKRAEAYAAAASVARDATPPLSRALFPRALALQRRWREVAEASAAVTADPGAEPGKYTTAHQDAWILQDALRAGLSACSNDPAAAAAVGGAQQLRQKYCAAFPNLAAALSLVH